MSRKIVKFLKFVLPIILWAGVIFTFSSLTTNPVSRIYWKEFVIKKTAHIIVYGVLATLLYRALINYDKKKNLSGNLSVIISSLYGMTDEFHQSFTPGREPTVRDVIIDTIGASLAIYLIWKVLPKAPKKLKDLAKKLQLI